MKRIWTGLALAVICLLGPGWSATAEEGSGKAGAAPKAKVFEKAKHAADQVLVRFKPGTSSRDAASAHSATGGRAAKRFKLVDKLDLVKLPPGLDVKQALKLYRQNPDVLYAEPDYTVEALLTPNDPSFGQLWGLHNTGQSGGTPGADIDAVRAWDLAIGSRDVVVAVIDTGIDYNHPDLAANMWRNEVECVPNGIDDDGNGHADDCHGIDTLNGDSNPMDDNDHGTHVAGTIGGVGNNSVGVVGVNWRAALLACKFLGSNGSGPTSGAIACMNHIAAEKDRGVNVVATNNSWGGGGFSQALYDAIKAHHDRGILFIAAAGNDSSDNDATPSYPSGYSLPNVISVAATTRTDGLAWFSNRGRRTVDLGAPGESILSTARSNTYKTFSGTSMATPHVAGTAALLKGWNPALGSAAIKNLILAGGEDTPALAGTTMTGKRLNAFGALTCSGSTVLSRRRPVADSVVGAVGVPVDLAALHINCANPNGEVEVTVEPGGERVTLLDDGLGTDQAAGDGVYAGQWTPSASGAHTLRFAGGDALAVQVLEGYVVAPAPFEYRAIAGTNLNLSDDSAARLTAPFPVLFGGGRFDTLFVGSNGHLSFTNASTQYLNAPLPTQEFATLVAPFWDDLYPLAGTTQNVFWAVTGTAPGRELVIEWRNVRNWTCRSDGTATVRFQVVFFEGSSDVLFNFADTTFGGACGSFDRGGSATVGVQVASGAARQWSFNTKSLTDGTALLWTLARPAIDVNPASADFGQVTLESSADRTFVVTNTGGGPLSGSAAVSTGFSLVSGHAFDLGPGQSQDIVVRFSPTQEGPSTGSLDVTSSAGDVSRPLTGTGAATPTAELTVLAPAGGVTWRSGRNETIRWSSAGLTGNVRIELSRNGGVTWETLWSSTANDGSQRWKVTKPSTTQARIRVRSVDNPDISDTSANFTIK